MIEIVLLVIAGVVAYFLYNTLVDYLKNPLHQNPQSSSPFGMGNTNDTPINFENPYRAEDTWEGKLKKNEFSILAAIIARVVWSDKTICPLERQLLDEILGDMAAESKNPKLSKEELDEIIQKEKLPSVNLDELCEAYVALTKGEYKKRLKVIEFLFALAYADGKLEESEQEVIIDIAAYFEITNDDFNAIYNAFEKEYANTASMSIGEAKAIFELENLASVDKKELDEKYHSLIKQAKQNIFDNKNINKSFQDTSLTRIKEIDTAYTLLAESVESQSKSKPDTTQQNHTSQPEQGEARKGWDF